MPGFFDLLRGGLDVYGRAKAAQQQTQMQTLPFLLQMMAQQRAQERQSVLDKANLEHIAAETAHLKEPSWHITSDPSGIYRTNLETGETSPLAGPDGKPLVPRQPLRNRQITSTDQGMFYVNPDGTLEPLTGPNGKQLRAPPAAGGTGALQAMTTPEGVVIVNKKTATSVPVAKPGATVSDTGGAGQLQPRATGNQKLQQLAIANRDQMNVIDEAIRRIRDHPDALGLKNLVGDIVRQRTDPEGVKTRAAVADIGSLKIHERSGAAVTASESPRLLPFVPSVRDTGPAAIAKLQRLRDYLEKETAALEAAGATPMGPGGKKYSPDNPFR